MLWFKDQGPKNTRQQHGVIAMANKYGPTRGELWFRLVAGLVGMALLIAAISARGMPSGPALFEVIGIGGAFFGGTAGLSAWRLWKG